MKKFWKTVNRGAVFSGIVVVVMVLYVIIGNWQFEKKHCKEIERVMNSYMDEIAAFNIAPQEIADNGYILTETQAKEKREQLFAIGRKYWTGIADKNSYYSWNYSDFQGWINTWYEYAAVASKKTPGLLKNFSYAIKDLKIVRNGPNAAIVTATIPRSVEGVNGTMYMGMVSVGNVGLSLADINSTEIVQVTENYALRAELLYVDGEWRISSMDLWQQYYD